MYHRSIWREMFGVVFRALVIIAILVVCIAIINAAVDVETSISDGQCNVAVLPIEGAIVPYNGFADFGFVTTPQEVRSFFAAAEDEEGIKAIMLEINTPGGTPVAAERIAERIKESELPVIALIGDAGSSGGYLVASAADEIIASRMSSVGGIGVTMSYLEESEKNEEEGITYVELSAGEFKDAGSPNKPLTAAERNLFEQSLEDVYQAFIDIVAENRDLPRDEVAELANGAAMPGERALLAGLVDRIGGRGVATAVLGEALFMEPSDIQLCEYDYGFLPFTY
jgi:protease-4